MLWQGKAWGWERTEMDTECGWISKRRDSLTEIEYIEKDWTVWREDSQIQKVCGWRLKIREKKQNSEEIGKKRSAEISKFRISYRWCPKPHQFFKKKEKPYIPPQEKEILQTRKVFIFLLESRLSSARQNSKKEKQRNACSKVYTRQVYVTNSRKHEKGKQEKAPFSHSSIQIYKCLSIPSAFTGSI